MENASSRASGDGAVKCARGGLSNRVCQDDRDGTGGIITDAPSHDGPVIAARDEFMNASDEEVSDEDGCLSRSMTIKEINTIMTERIMISRVASEVTQTGAPLRDESVIAVREELNLHLSLPLMTAST